MATTNERLQEAITHLDLVIDQAGTLVPLRWVIVLLKAILTDNVDDNEANEALQLLDEKTTAKIKLSDTRVTPEQVKALTELPTFEEKDDDNQGSVLDCAGTSYDGDLR